MKSLKYLFLIILIISCSIGQLCFLFANWTWWGQFWSSLNLILICLLFLLILHRFKMAFFIALIGGMFLDYYSLFPFGFYCLILFLCFLIGRRLMQTLSYQSSFSVFITSFSLVLFYQVISTLLTILLFRVGLLKELIIINSLFNRLLLFQFLTGILSNTLIIVSIFLATQLINHRWLNK